MNILPQTHICRQIHFIVAFAFMLLVTGCGSLNTDRKVLADQKKLVSLSKKNGNQRFKEIDQEFTNAKVKGISISVLANEDNPLNELATKSYISLDKQGKNPSKNKPFSFTRFTNVSNLTEKKLTGKDFILELHKNQLKAKNPYNLIHLNDFSSIYPMHFPLFSPQIAKFIHWKDESGKKVKYVSPFDDVKKTLDEKSWMAFPMGYHEFNGMIPYTLDMHVIAYNHKALELYKFLKGQPVEAKFSELGFEAFREYLANEQFSFYYPSYKSSDEPTKNSGFAFLCQLIYWQNPTTYTKKLLKQPKNKEFLKMVKKATRFLSSNQNTFKPCNTMAELVEKVDKDHFIPQLPKTFNPDKPDLKLTLNEEYWMNVSEPVKFAYIPESFLLEQYANSVDKRVLNKKMYSEIIKRKKARAKRKSSRKKRKTKRKKSSKKSSKKKKKKKKKKPLKKQEAGLFQAKWFMLDKMIGLRQYVAVPQNSQNQTQSLAIASQLLSYDVQKNLCLAPRFKRIIRPDIENEIYILKMVEPDVKRSRKRNRWQMIDGFLPQNQIKNRFLPMLNANYLRMINSLKLAPKKGG